MKGREKKGQFYLIAAILLIAILIGFTSTINFSRNNPQPKLTEIRDELRLEGEKVLDYEIYNSENTQFEDFARDYSRHIEDIEIYYVIGDSVIEAYKYDGALKNTSGITVTNDSNTINLTIGSSEYSFDLRKGKNFYFVLSKDVKGERYVLKG